VGIPDYPPVVRPIVWRHPVTGRTILNLSALNIQSIVGLDRQESDTVIQALLDHVTQPRFTYLHDWREDDVMLWDNYRMMHQATGHTVDEIRMVERSTIRSDVEVGRVLADAEPCAA
jgi:taurine dioxygenase